ncbi:hypothetical protein [Streptomyces sp. ISL-99]|uniref:hypothetical protein n=1 Tax=Streptomyces sp. ISL-99 TaxID=2819193 RepID=UPI0027E590AF|nr:hypothetical protein [Streptomyces sp. ISL-99]
MDHLLEKIGVREELEDGGYIKKYGIEWVWREQREPWKVHLQNVLNTPMAHARAARLSKIFIDRGLGSEDRARSNQLRIRRAEGVSTVGGNF